MDIRQRFYEWVGFDVFKLKLGQMLPWYMIALRYVLFPVDTLYWRLSQTRGYQLRSNSWLIEGCHFSNYFFQMLCREKTPTCWFRVVKRENGYIEIERRDQP